MSQMSLIKSTEPYGLDMIYDTSHIEYCNSVYMCIKEKGSSNYLVPPNFEDIIKDHVLETIFLTHPTLRNDTSKYCYMTVKKQYIPPNGIGNRDGWHIDGFGNDQQMDFIWSDDVDLSSEVAIGYFVISNDHNKSLEEMAIQSRDMPVITLKSDRLYFLGQNCVHRPSINRTDKAILRTFIKITFTDELFNCYGNAWNYLIPHISPSTMRKEHRNHGRL